jgi:hypothetical protein
MTDLTAPCGLTLVRYDEDAWRDELTEARREAAILRGLFVACFDAAVKLQRENDALRRQCAELHEERGRIARQLFGWTPSHEVGEINE